MKLRSQYFSNINNPRQVNEELALRRYSLVQELLGSTPIHSMPNGDLRAYRRGSLKLDDKGYYSFENETSGDFITLIMEAYECNFSEAMKCAVTFIAKTEPDHILPFSSIRGDVWNPEKSRDAAWALWRNAGQNPKLFLRYLRWRCIRQPMSGALSKLRFIPRCKYAETGEYYPCGIVKLQDSDRGFAGIQRIYLSPNCRDKAPITFPKMALGHSQGAAMQLCDPNSQLCITEGLEEALTLIQLYPSLPVWGYVGSSILGCTVPAGVKHVIIATDADAAGEQYRQKLSQRLIAEGYRVSIIIPSGAKDFNEMLQNEEYNEKR